MLAIASKQNHVCHVISLALQMRLCAALLVAALLHCAAAEEATTPAPEGTDQADTVGLTRQQFVVDESGEA